MHTLYFWDPEPSCTIGSGERSLSVRVGYKLVVVAKSDGNLRVPVLSVESHFASHATHHSAAS